MAGQGGRAVMGRTDDALYGEAHERHGVGPNYSRPEKRSLTLQSRAYFADHPLTSSRRKPSASVLSQ